MIRLNSLTLSRRLGLVIASALMGILVLTAIFLVGERRLIMEERKNSVRQTVEVAHGIVAHQHDLVTKGAISEEEGKRRAMQALAGLRYSGNEYFWINDLQARMVMHAVKPELNGKDIREGPRTSLGIPGYLMTRSRRKLSTSTTGPPAPMPMAG